MTKKVLFKYWALLMVAILPMVISSCKDDDDEKDSYKASFIETKGDPFEVQNEYGRVHYFDSEKAYGISPKLFWTDETGMKEWVSPNFIHVGMIDAFVVPENSAELKKYDDKIVKFSGKFALSGYWEYHGGACTDFSAVYVYRGELYSIEETTVEEIEPTKIY